MSIQHIIAKYAAIVAVILIAGCSKSSSPPPHAATQSNTQDYAQDERKAFAESAFMTNTLDVLQARYQEDGKQIEEVQTELDSLHKTYKITDQPYLDELHKLQQMIEFHKQLQTKIEADKLDEQFKSQNSPH
jgi:hypothetical protein